MRGLAFASSVLNALQWRGADLQGFGVLLSRLRIRPLTAQGRVHLAPGAKIEGRVWIPGPGRIHIASGVRLRGRRAPIELHAHQGAEIRLEDGVTIEAGASIDATERVEIGARATIGAFAKILDNHFHRTLGERDERPPSVPIHVGSDAVIGPRAILLPGARLAAGAIVGAGEVLSNRREVDVRVPRDRAPRVA